jgi:hypothetical protein
MLQQLTKTPCSRFLAVTKRTHKGALATTTKPLASIREAKQGIALQLFELNLM